MKSADFARLLGPALKTDALEVTKDIDEATVTAALAKTRRYPPRQRRDHALPDAPHALCATAPPPIRVTHDGPADKASVLLSWPLFVWDPAVREQRTIDLLGDILQDELIQTVRRQLGKTYSPRSGSSRRAAATRAGRRPVDHGAWRRPDGDRRDAQDRRQVCRRRRSPEALERAATAAAQRRPDPRHQRCLVINVLDGSWARPDRRREQLAIRLFRHHPG